MVYYKANIGKNNNSFEYGLLTGFAFQIGRHEVFGNVVSLDGQDARDFFHDDDLDAGGDVIGCVHAAFACTDHGDVDDAVAQTDEFDVAAISLQEGSYFV